MIRRVLLSLLIFCVFVVICVYVIVTAQGTKIDNSGNVVNTSIIRVNSIPKDVSVYINDKQASLTENRVEWLEPGTVKVTLKKNGYTTWEKEVTLKAGIIEDIYAQLYPDKLNFDKLTSINVDKFFFSNNTDYIFYSVINAVNSKDNGFWRLKLTRNLLDIGAITPTKIYTYNSDDLKMLRENTYEAQISDDNSKAIISLPEAKIAYYLDFNNPVLISLNDILTFFPSQINWLNNSTNVVVTDGKLLIYLDVNSRQQNLIYYSPDKKITYSVNGNNVYYYRNDKEKLYAYVNGQSTEVQFLADLNIKNKISEILTPTNNNSLIYFLAGNLLYIYDLNNHATLNIQDVKEVKALSSNGKYLAFEDIEGKLETLILKSSADLKSYTNNIYTISLDPSNLVSLSYTPSGNNLIGLIKDTKGDNALWFMDYDGMNPVKLINGEKIINNNFAVSSNGLDLYLLLNDSSNDVTSTQSIYNYSLELNQ